MGNLEKPLTWILGIAFVGYLFIVNCKCDEENACSLNNGFNIPNAGNYGNTFKFDALTVEDLFGSLNELDEDITEVTAEDGDTTVVTETNIDSTEVEIE